MGTILSIITIIAAGVIVVLNPTSVLVFYALGAIVISHLGAWLLRARPGWFLSATLLGWASVMISTPLALTTTQLNQLRRIVRRERDGWENAQATLDFFEPLVSYAVPLLIAVTLYFVVMLGLAVRRANQGGYRYLLDGANGMAATCVATGKIVSVLYIPMIVIILYDVTQRKYLGYNPNFTSTAWYETFSSTRLQEMEWHLHAVLFLMALAYGYVKDAHVRIELVRDTFRPRTKAWIELFGALLFLVPYCYVIIEYGTENMMRAYNIGEGSDALTGLPYRFIIKGFLPLGFVFVALAGLSAALKCIVFLFGPVTMREESGQYTTGGVHSAPKAEA